MIGQSKPKNQNAASKKQLQKATKEIESQERRERNDMIWLLNQPQGRRVLWKYMAFTNIYGGEFSESNNFLQHQSGMRKVGNRILQDIIDARPEAYIEMMLEAKGERQDEPKPRTKQSYSSVEPTTDDGERDLDRELDELLDSDTDE